MDDTRTGFYAPSWANIDGGWASAPEIENLWTPRYDELLEDLVDKCAPYILPFASEIIAKVDADNGTDFLNSACDSEKFVLARAYKLPHLRAKWLAGVERETRKTFTCPLCKKKEPMMSLHPDIIHEYGLNPPWCRICNYVVHRYEKFWSPSIRTRLSSLMKNIDSPRACDVCKKTFSLEQNIFTRHTTASELVDTLYPNLFAKVCPICMEKAFSDNRRRSKPSTLKSLYDLFLFVGKVPTRDYALFFYLYQDTESIITLVKLLSGCRTPDGYTTECGSFFHALVESGVLPTGSRKMKIGSMTLAKDGHLCFSIPEKDIDDYLLEHSLPHLKEILYPGSKLRADWEITNRNPRTFIEYFGLIGNAEYDAKIIRKRAIAAKHGIRLLEIIPGDNWSETLAEKINNGEKI